MINLCSFKMFGGAHIIYVLLAIVLFVGLFFLLRKYDDKVRRFASIALIAVAGLFVVLEMFGRIIQGMDFFENMPLAPWQIFVYIGVFVEITKRENWIKFGYFIVIPLCALGLFVVPNYYTTVGVGNLSVISYFLGNAIISLYFLLQLIWSGEYLSKGDLLNSYMNYIVIVAFVHILNVIFRFSTYAVHSNYFGTMGEEYDVVMQWLNNLIPVPFVHMMPLIVVVVGLEFLMLLPFDLMKTRKDNREHIEELVALGNLKAQQNARKAGKRGGSQILVRGENKAQPKVQKNDYQSSSKDGFVSVNKMVQTHKDSFDKD